MIQMEMGNKDHIDRGWVDFIKERKSRNSALTRVNAAIQQDCLALILENVARSADLTSCTEWGDLHEVCFVAHRKIGLALM